MTDRFSPEYIAFILSDEASVLQKQWKPKAQDVFLWKAGDESLYMVVYAQEPKHRYKYWRVDYIYLSPYQPNIHEMAVHPEQRTDDLMWLPTLTDLLDMIEEAGYWWSTGLDYDGDDKWYTVSAGNIEAGGYIENDHKDRMVAAAKLAVRVLEEKE